MQPRDFLSLTDFSSRDLEQLVARAIELKRIHDNGVTWHPCRNRTLVILFEQPSTRTRVSLEAGMAQLGGYAIFLSARDTQSSRGESPGDTARVLSQMADILALRTTRHETLLEFAEHATVPVINAMTPRVHPCQVLADMQTYHELRGPIRGRKVAFVGDGYNMCHSYIDAAPLFGFHLEYACPPGYEPKPVVASKYVTAARTPVTAVTDADLVVTDVWSSMGHEEDERKIRLEAFAGYQINPQLMDKASENALFMHCLPAHPGEELSADMLDDRRSAVWQEAGNRLHSQKAVLEFLLHSSPAGHPFRSTDFTTMHRRTPGPN